MWANPFLTLLSYHASGYLHDIQNTVASKATITYFVRVKQGVAVTGKQCSGRASMKHRASWSMQPYLQLINNLSFL